MLIQYPAAKKLGFEGKIDLFHSFRNVHIKKVFHLMIPRTLGIAVNQFNLLIITVFASLLSAGSLAIFNFAQNLQGVPVGIIGSSFAIAVFPTLAAVIAQNKKEEFVENFSHAFRQIIFFVIPITIFILLLRAQIVRVLLGAGKFDWEDTVLTYQCLGIFVLSLFAQSLTPLLARSFYAMHNTKTPFYIALITEAVNIGVILFFWKYFPQDGIIINFLGRELEFFRIFGLAIAFTVAAVVQMLLLLFVLRAKFENLDDKRIIQTAYKVCLISIISAFAIQASKYIVGSYMNMSTFVGIFSQLIISATVGVLVFSGASQFFQLEEFLVFKRMAVRRLFRGKNVVQENIEDVKEVEGV
jgi:putative peptidoglycan lipid II flippase